jgi:hypothetical protein
MKNASAGSYQISPKRSSFVKLRTLGATTNHKDPLRDPEYAIEAIAYLGAAFIKRREARKML